MKKSLLIISAVAILGILAVYTVPLTAKGNLTSSTTTNPVATAATTSTSSTAAQVATQSSTSTSTMNSTSMMSSLKDGSYTGTSSSNQFGDVQIKLTISGGKITDVAAVSYPSADRHSLQISQYAIPQLKQEVLAAQSASIDSVSGASYTSQSYVESLQSAINQAKA
jgi:uncharacterized protein with FMN-binding domain